MKVLNYWKYTSISQIYTTKTGDNQVYYVVGKGSDFSLEFEQEYEVFLNFIFAFHKGELVYSVYENEVAGNLLGQLLDEIRGIDESNFYNSFIKAIQAKNV